MSEVPLRGDLEVAAGEESTVSGPGLTYVGGSRDQIYTTRGPKFHRSTFDERFVVHSVGWEDLEVAAGEESTVSGPGLAHQLLKRP